MKTPKRTRKPADPFALASALAQHGGIPDMSTPNSTITGGLSELYHACLAYSAILEAATDNDPLTEPRRGRLLDIAAITLGILHAGEMLPPPATESDGLTPARYAILAYINAYRTKKGMAPTYAEIQIGLGYKSTAPVFEHVRRLKADGYIISGHGIRSLTPTQKGGQVR